MTTHVQASEPFVLGVRIPKLDISDFVGFCLADSGGLRPVRIHGAAAMRYAAALEIPVSYTHLRAHET